MTPIKRLSKIKSPEIKPGIKARNQNLNVISGARERWHRILPCAPPVKQENKNRPKQVYFVAIRQAGK
jgi:hypothetical protein